MTERNSSSCQSNDANGRANMRQTSSSPARPLHTQFLGAAPQTEFRLNRLNRPPMSKARVVSLIQEALDLLDMEELEEEQ